MYRRIEILHPPEPQGSKKRLVAASGITGIMFGGTDEVVDAWIMMNGPRRRVNKNVRFYFTEKGWDLYGRNTVKELMKSKTPYRVLKKREHDVSVYYKDDIQVAIHPKRKGR